MTSWSETIRAVKERADGRREYCRMHQVLQGARFHVDHILPRSRQGTTELDNLAWCCPSCNLHKSIRIEAADPFDGAIVPLFHPRRDLWAEHFRWDHYEIVGSTPQGRATVLILEWNHPRRVLIRQVEHLVDLFPPR